MHLFGMEGVLASCTLGATLMASAAFQLRRRRNVMAHICGVVAALLPLILIPSDNPLITLSFAMNCAHLYSVHALYRRFLKHWDVYDKWLLGQLEELPPSTMRIKPLLESDLVVAQHLVFFVDLTVRRPLASLTAAEKQGYVLSRLQTAAYVVPWLLISWLLLPTMASDYMHAACCSSLGKAVQQLPFAHEPLCHSHTHCMDLPRASTDNLARPHLSTVAAAFVDAADNAIANAPSFVLTLAPALASGLSLLMMLEIVAAISWFVSCFKVIEAINTLLHACMGYTVHSLLGNLFSSPTLAEFWGKRWNRVIQPILKHAFFLSVYSDEHPLLTMALGVVLTFFMSGIIHSIPMALAAPIKHSLVMQLFFMAHAVAVLVETPIVALAKKRSSNSSSSTWLHHAIYAHGVTFVVTTSIILFHFTLLGVANVVCTM